MHAEIVRWLLQQVEIIQVEQAFHMSKFAYIFFSGEKNTLLIFLFFTVFN